MKMRTSLVCALVALVSAVGWAANVSCTWQTSVSDGWYTNAANWTSSSVPQGENDITQFFVERGKADKDCHVRFSDFDSKTLALGVRLYHPSRFVLDASDATYRILGTETARNRDGSWYPFYFLFNTNGTTYAMKMNFVKDRTEYKDPVLTFKDTVLSFSDLTPHHAEVTMTGGLVDLIPGWETLGRSPYTFEADSQSVSAGGVDKVEGFSLCLDGVKARFPKMTWGGAASSGRLVVTNGADLTVYEAFAFPTAATTTNALEIVDGGKVSLTNCPATGVSIGNSGATDIRTFLHVGGEGSLLDFSGQKTVTLWVADLTLDGGDVWSPTNILTISGADSRLTVNGGYLGPKDASASGRPTGLYVSREATSSTTVEINGGTVNIYPPNPGYSSDKASCLLGPGEVSFTVNDGEFTCGDFDLGYTSGTKDTWQTFTMNGGTSKISRLYLGASRNDTLKWQHPTVRLNGGVLISPSIFVHNDVCSAFKENSLFTADGGTVQVSVNADGWIKNFGRAEIGAKGLVFDTLTWNPALEQSFTNKAGEDGVLVKRGKGILAMKMASYDVARTVVEQGTLKFANDITLATELVITNAATVSLEDTPAWKCSQLTIDALTVPDGKLVLDAGDVVHVRSGRVNVDGLKISFVTAPTEEQALNVFQFDGDVTANASVRAALRRMTLGNAVAAGRHAAFEMSYDAATQKTTLTMTVRQDAAALTDKTVWNGPEWNADGWSEGVPTATKIASFENGSAPTDVTVPTAAEAGALAFSSGSYAFDGDNELFLSADQGAARIDVTAGDQIFNLPLAAIFQVQMNLAEGTSVTLADGFRDGGIGKTGKGRLILDGASTFVKTTSVGDGLNTVRSEKALGTASESVLVQATSDTLAFAEPDGEPMAIGSKIRLASSSTPSNAIIVKADTDVAFTDFGVTSGVLIKRGTGRMTIHARSDATVELKGSDGGTAKSYNQTLKTVEVTTFAADGSAPSLETEYCGLNIAEGELEIVGKPGDKDVSCSTSILIGMPTAGAVTEASQPRLTVDGAYLTAASGSGHASLGQGAGRTGALATNAVLKVINGGTANFPTLRVGMDSSYDGVFPLVAVTNGSLLCQNAITLSAIGGQNPATRAAIYRAKDGDVATVASVNQWGHTLSGSIDADFDNVFFGGKALPAILTWSSAACGRIIMKGGTFAFASIVAQAVNDKLGADLMFAFDDTLWSWGTGDFTLAADVFKPSSRAHFTMVGKGLKVAPATGETFTANYLLEGAGGFVKDGAGTVAFGDGAYGFSGLLDIRAGVADLSAAGALAAVTACGPGTLRGATVTCLTLKETLDDGTVVGAPVLDGVTAGSVVVDLGHDETDPLDPESLKDLTVATVASGTSVGRWKLVGTGVPKLKGSFVLEDNKVVLKSASIPGMLLIVR